MAKLVSKTYGDALFEVAEESGKLDAYWEEAKAVLAALEDCPQLFKLMAHPKIVKEEKIKIIEEIFSGKASGELVGLLRMLVDKEHFEEVREVLDYFISRLCDDRDGVDRGTESRGGKTSLRHHQICAV